jgi:hypothetical protein
VTCVTDTDRVRWRWLAAVAGVATAIWIGVEVIGILATIDDPEAAWSLFGLNPSYRGWQLYVAATGCLMVALVLATLSVATLVRLRRVVPLTSPSRGLLGLIGLVLGSLITGPLVAGGTGAGLHRVSTHTAAAHRAVAAAQRARLRILGDATHHPVGINHGTPASASLAAPLLKPSDLGAAWDYWGDPPVALRRPVASPGDVIPVSRARAWYIAESWTGHRWQTHQDMVEVSNRFASRATARRALRARISGEVGCPPQFTCPPPRQTHWKRSRERGVEVWRSMSAGPDGLVGYLLRGRTLIYVRSFAPRHDFAGARNPQQVLDAALRAFSRA